MMIRKLTLAAALTALTACSSNTVPETIGYAYPDYWGRPATSTAGPTSADNAAPTSSPGTTAIFGTHTTAASGVYLFPPDPYQ